MTQPERYLLKVVFNLADLESPTRREYSYLVSESDYNAFTNYHSTHPTQPMPCIVESARDIISMAYIVGFAEYDPTIKYRRIVQLCYQAKDYLIRREQYLKAKKVQR